MERIVFLDCSTLDASIRRPAFPHQWEEYATTAPGEIVERLKDATIVITNKVPLRADTLAQLPGLKLIAEAATGVNNIDVDWCREHGIAVANIRNYAVHAVPEHVFMMILALRRNLRPIAPTCNGGCGSNPTSSAFSPIPFTIFTAAPWASSAMACWDKRWRKWRKPSA